MRIYRYILGCLMVIIIALGLGVISYGISQSHFNEEETLFAMVALCIIYFVLQFLFLTKFGFYRTQTSEKYNKLFIIGVPLTIILSLILFLGFESRQDIVSTKIQATTAEHASYRDLLDVFDQPQRIPDHLALNYLAIDKRILEINKLYSVKRLLFSDVISGFVYKVRNAQGTERIIFATFHGINKQADEIEVGRRYDTPTSKNILQYEFNEQNELVLQYTEEPITIPKEEVIMKTKTVTYSVNVNTGILELKSTQF